jgi:hypothetical protein
MAAIDVDALIARAREQGWPDGLMARALAVRTPRFQLSEWLNIKADPNDLFQFERIVEVFEKLAAGPYRAREANFRDLEAFEDLWANSEEKVGDAFVTVQRGPDSFAQFRLQPDASISVIEAEGELLASMVWAPFNCLVAGEPVCIHFAQGLRVRADRRREGLGDLVRRYPARALQAPTVGQVMYLRIGNANMGQFLDAVKFQAGAERPQQIATVAYLDARPDGPAPAGLRPIAEADLARCAALINRTHAGLDLFRPYGAESLRDMLDGGVWGEGPPWRRRVYGWADVVVLEEAGEVVACAGLWDRGRDMREVWREPDGATRLVEVAAALDLGCASGREDALAALLRHLAGRAAALGRQSLMVDLSHLPAVAARLGDLGSAAEQRILEWSPFMPHLPKRLGECFLDLRYW